MVAAGDTPATADGARLISTNDALINPLGHWLWALPLVKPQLALGLTGISSCVTDVWPHTSGLTWGAQLTLLTSL